LKGQGGGGEGAARILRRIQYKKVMSAPSPIHRNEKKKERWEAPTSERALLFAELKTIHLAASFKIKDEEENWFRRRAKGNDDRRRDKGGRWESCVERTTCG